MKSLFKSAIILALLITSCSYRPILDPNEKYRSVGQEQAKADVDQCLAEANDYLKQYKAAHVAKETARKGAIGAGIGAVTGLLSKGNMKSTLRGGLIGTGVGAVAGAALALGEDKIKPDVVKQRYTTNCLSEKGYNVLGWQ